jgi:hypothetical protein
MRVHAVLTALSVAAASLLAEEVPAHARTPCAESICPAYWATPVEPAEVRVAVVGDSYVRQLEFFGPTHPASTTALTRTLVEQGWQGHVDGLSGWPTARVRSLAEKATGNEATAIAVVAGVNDVAWSMRQRDERAALAHVLADVQALLVTATSARCVVWPTVAPGAPNAHRANRAVRLINSTLRAWDVGDPGVVVPEWGRALRAHPRWIGGDGLHLSVLGERRLQTVLLDALHRCLAT